MLNQLINECVDGKKPRLSCKTVAHKDWEYFVGYDDKVRGDDTCSTLHTALTAHTRLACQDRGRPHFLGIRFGIDDDELKQGKELYFAKASLISKTSDKTNGNPWADSKQMAFKLGNLHRLGLWCVFEHSLRALWQAMSLPLLITWMMQTGKYRLDESVLAGKWNDIAGFDVGRSEAMWRLGLMDTVEPANQAEVLALIETILYNAPQQHSTVEPAPGIPSPAVLTTFSLSDAKKWCEVLNDKQGCTADSQPRRRQRSGRAIVIDLLTSNEAQSAANLMAESGLSTRTLFGTDQLRNMCGYLAACWAVDLHNFEHDLLNSRGDFSQYPIEQAVAHNVPLTVYAAHTSMPDWGYEDEAQYLSTNQVHELAHHWANEASWLTVGPLNHWREYFERTISDPREHGRLHIMVANTVTAVTDVSDAEPAPGSHWFLTAWFVDPEDEE